jgi:DNA-binding beta-propeller fold protein YncE
MLALIYLVLMFWIGDLICRRFHSFFSGPHRLACAFLLGLFASGWFVYLTARVFAGSTQPLLWGNLFFFVVVIATFAWTKRKATSFLATDHGHKMRPSGSDRLDWLLVGVYFIIACWLMFATLNSSGGKLQIGNNQYSDFGPNTAIMQSFAVGHNFPTEYPHFSGDRIRYHFFYYFQAGNLEFLGLDPALSLNLLSIFSLVSMLILVMTLGEVLFNSRIVGRIGATLFFFFGTLSYFAYLRKHDSLGAAVRAILNERAFLPSGFPYRGEDWGVWSLVVFLNQRHLAFSISVVLLVLVFLVHRYRQVDSNLSAGVTRVKAKGFWSFIAESKEFIFFGVLLGLLPMWNSATFAAAGVVLTALLLLFPLRKQMLVLGIVAGIVALPQVAYLNGGSRAPSPDLFYWGYTLSDPTIWNVIKYLGFTFGFKWLLIALALIFATGLQRRFFLAISTLLLVAFSLQLSVEVLANHKFLHIWIIIANLFAAYGLWRLWSLRVQRSSIPAKAVAAIVVVLVTAGGFIDLFPIRNTYRVEVPYKNDPVIEWLQKETDPQAIFLTDRFVTHPILMAGRRVFYGFPYYAWSASYRTAERDTVYRQMWQERNPLALVKLLQDNGVSYVALDDAVRRGEFGKNMNEAVYRKYFPTVLENGPLVIFKVPQITGIPDVTADPEASALTSVNMLSGGKGKGNGQFDWPRGIAADTKGNVFVGDVNNGRIQKFSDDGTFLGAFGQHGEGEGQLKEPGGVAVDSRGNVYVANFHNHRVEKFKSDGTFLARLPAPDHNFGPRDVVIGSDNAVYVADENSARIVKFAEDGKVLLSFGSRGNGDGQFDQITSVAVDDAADRVFVADPRQRRIVIFDRNGKFIANWFVEQWQQVENAWYLHDLVVETETRRVYASSTQTDEVLVFDFGGKKLASLKPEPPDKLEGAASLALLKNKLYVVNTFASRISVIDLPLN